MTTAFTVEFTPAHGPRRRIRYEPRAAAAGYWRIAAVWHGCGWRIQGQEPVTDVVCDRDSPDDE